MSPPPAPSGTPVLASMTTATRSLTPRSGPCSPRCFGRTALRQGSQSTVIKMGYRAFFCRLYARQWRGPWMVAGGRSSAPRFFLHVRKASQEPPRNGGPPKNYRAPRKEPDWKTGVLSANQSEIGGLYENREFLKVDRGPSMREKRIPTVLTHSQTFLYGGIVVVRVNCRLQTGALAGICGETQPPG